MAFEQIAGRGEASGGGRGAQAPYPANCRQGRSQRGEQGGSSPLPPRTPLEAKRKEKEDRRERRKKKREEEE